MALLTEISRRIWPLFTPNSKCSQSVKHLLMDISWKVKSKQIDRFIDKPQA
ncbi:hypothetical protein BofuT4_uP163220.1 [Botrytis cinerea T4]|uniref:Uncharacterized protein n=1 Tax=Botryotinia fuckeliana (strain T4) TaxID=999810 RepID=G2YTC9_BOTF4|nr:hypothetical protein BofuT4_uP163220.1 [Botrytis cinerea T4]